MWQSFILCSPLLISWRETFHMLHSCSLLAERAFHLDYPWVELHRTTKCKVGSKLFFFFPDKGGPNIKVWWLEKDCFTAVDGHLSWVTYDIHDNSTLSSEPRLNTRFLLTWEAAQLYTVDIFFSRMDANNGSWSSCFLPDNRATTGLTVEQSQRLGVIFLCSV